MRHFQIVAQTANLREAAGLLHISHAGLSKSVRTLEDELGVKLLNRDGRGIRVTSAGTRILREIDQILQDEAKLHAIARNTKQKIKREFRIGTFEVFSTYLCPLLVESLGMDVRVSIQDMIPGEIENQLTTEQIDLGITYIPVPKPDLDHLKVKTIEMGVFGTEELARKKMTFRELPFVVPLTKVEGSPTKARGLDGWPDDRVQRNILYSVTLMETALALIRKGFAVGYLPKFVVDLHNQLMSSQYRLIEMDRPRSVSNRQAVYLVKKKNSEESDRIKKISRILRSLT